MYTVPFSGVYVPIVLQQSKCQQFEQKAGVEKT